MSALTIKSVDDSVLSRIAEKAGAAGLSVQEYVRQLLARDAQLRSADEMVELQQQRRKTASAPEALSDAVLRNDRRRMSTIPE